MFTLVDGKSVLVTGGTGSFGRRFVRRLAETTRARRIIVFSRDELKQAEMHQEFAGEERLRFFLGDVRDRERCYRALDGVDVVVHAAALKQIPIAEYNPFEVVRTNILGAQNLIEASIDRGVSKVVALSTDKASSPLNLYGATKLVSDKLFVAGNAYVGSHRTRFSVVRYGNVVGSRGSVVPIFQEAARHGRISITHTAMTRFWITLDQAIDLVLLALSDMRGGEIFVPKIPSMRVVDLAKAIAPEAEIRIDGIRPGEKLHEEMISRDAARRTIDRGSHYVILPERRFMSAGCLEGEPVPEGFRYSSDRNDDWLDGDALRALLDD